MKKKKTRLRDVHAILELLIDRATQVGKTGEVEFSVPVQELGEIPETYDPVYLVFSIKTRWDTEEVVPEFTQSSDEEGESSEGKRSSNSDTKH